MSKSYKIVRCFAVAFERGCRVLDRGDEVGRCAVLDGACFFLTLLGNRSSATSPKREASSIQIGYVKSLARCGVLFAPRLSVFFALRACEAL